MNPYIVYEIEKHPDRLIGNVFGPFKDYEAADTYAKAAYEHDYNMLKDHLGRPNGSHRYDYRIEEMLPPETA